MDRIWEEICRLQEEIRRLPYHKGTEHHIGRLRAKIARLKEKLEQQQKRGGGGRSWAIKKTGDATCVLLGPPSVGKSTLLNALTQANSKTGEYAFTTTIVVPGMLFYQGAYIQLLDLPGIIKKAAQGKGGGRQIFSVVRVADLVILVVDVDTLDWISKTKEELAKVGIHLGEKPKIPAHLKDIWEIANVWLPTLVVVNKIDKKQVVLPKEAIGVSAKTGKGLAELKRRLWDKLQLVRVYPKREKNSKVNKGAPLIVRKGTTLGEVAEKISTELAAEVKSALIWGPGAKYPAQQVSLATKVEDGMEIYFVKG